MKSRYIATATIAAAMAIAVPFIGGHEGDKLEAYQDVVGVWTICSGIAYVHKGTKYTQAQCDKINASTIGKFMDHVAGKLTKPTSPRTLAAMTSFSYNIGQRAFDRSSTLRLWNQGDFVTACGKMMLWDKVGGRDCSIQVNNCYGIYTRRKAETALCISGLNKE